MIYLSRPKEQGINYWVVTIHIGSGGNNTLNAFSSRQAGAFLVNAVSP
jgi:hypothetical protein